MRVLIAASLTAGVLLAGCGGGGGGGDGGTNPGPAADTIPPATGTYGGTVDFEAGYTEAITGGGGGISILGNRESSNGTQTFQESWRSVQASNDFFGTNHRSVQLVTGFFSRDQNVYFSGDIFHELAPVRIYGVKWQDGTVSVATPTGSLPTAGRVGDRGDFYTYVTYTDSSRTTVEARGTTTWSIQPDTDQAVFLCFDTTEVDREGTNTSQECAQAGATGHFNGRGRFVFTDAAGNRTVFNHGP